MLLIAGAAFLLLLGGLGAGIYWYLFGTPEIDSAQLVPANTLAFASIPNGVTVAAGYQTSRLKTLVDSPNAKPLLDYVVSWIGQKNADLLQDFLPNLSGQSFVAITHFDYDHPEQVGLIAAMKPKAGFGNFDQFVDKLKATWPDILKQGKTGTGEVAGVHYDWIQGPGASDKICVAHVGGWIVTSWGEASLQDWVERFHNKSGTTSLAGDPNYKKALERLGDNPTTVLYLNCRSLLNIAQQQLTKSNPAAADYLAHTLVTPDGAALATRFDGGEIVDRFSFLIPHPTQLESGLSADPCPFKTLKFAGGDTRFYWAGGIDWKECYKKLKSSAPSTSHAPFNPLGDNLTNFLVNWAHGAGLNIQQNIVDPLGSEISVQSEWSQDSIYPDIGLFVKLDKPEDFKPTINAIIDTVRKAYVSSAVVKDLNSNGQNFAVLQSVQASQFSPTITEDGPYLGVFLTANQAVRAFQRDGTAGLSHNAEFERQTSGKLAGATQVFFLDAPHLLDRGYQTALPYLSLAGMFDKNLGPLLKGRQLPQDLGWLAPMGTWSCVITPQEEGLQGYSISGIGNQGILLGAAAAGGVNFMQGMGWLPKPAPVSATPYVSGPPPTPASPDVPSSTSPAADAATVAKISLSADAPAVDTTAATPGSIIYLTSTNKIYFDNTPVALDQIDDFLKNKKAADSALKLAVKVDKFASADTLSRVMGAATSAGFGVLPFTYTSVSDPPQPADPATNSAPVASPDNAAPSTHALSVPPTNSTSETNAPALAPATSQ